MSNVSLKDFHVGESAWSIEHRGNEAYIVEKKVVKIGRKYVTTDGFGQQYAELPRNGEYLSDYASCGYESWLFPSKQAAQKFVQKKELVLKLRRKVDHIFSFGEKYTLTQLKKACAILDGEADQESGEPETTKLVDGITECCGYDFGTYQFNEDIKCCPMCGRKIVKRV